MDTADRCIHVMNTHRYLSTLHVHDYMYMMTMRIAYTKGDKNLMGVCLASANGWLYSLTRYWSLVQVWWTCKFNNVHGKLNVFNFISPVAVLTCSLYDCGNPSGNKVQIPSVSSSNALPISLASRLKQAHRGELTCGLECCTHKTRGKNY